MERPRAASLLVLGSLGSMLAAQAGPEGGTDPYTRGEPAAVARAGYAGFGPFEFVDGRDTREIERWLGNVGMRWVETAHFKIGSSLGAYEVPGGGARRRIGKELGELRRRLPRVPARAAVLDPWLRLHLYAWRVERLYAEVRSQLGASDMDFAGSGPAAKVPEPGLGPYLGMPHKFTLLLTRRVSSIERFFRSLTGEAWERPRRHVFNVCGSMFFGTAAEIYGAGGDQERRLHAQVVFHVVQNLLCGYGGSWRGLPAWWRTGVALVWLRRLDPSGLEMSWIAGDAGRARARDWPRRVRRMVEHGAHRSAAELLRLSDRDRWTVRDRLEAWARVEFLMAARPAGFRTYMKVMKDPRYRAPEPMRAKTLQEIGLQQGWGLDLATFDSSWRRYVRRRYRR